MSAARNYPLLLPSVSLEPPCSPAHHTLPPNCGPDLGQEGHLSASFWLCRMATFENSLKFSLQRASEVSWTPVTEVGARHSHDHAYVGINAPGHHLIGVRTLPCNLLLVIVKVDEALCPRSGRCGETLYH